MADNSKRKIYRTVIEVEVFSDGEPYEPTSLAVVAHAITDGDFIGDWAIKSTEDVPDSDVRDHLLRIGNDGTWFDDLDDLDD